MLETASSPMTSQPIPSTQGSFGTPPRIAVMCNVYYESLHAGMGAYSAAHNWDLDSLMYRNPGFLPKQCNWSGILASPFKNWTWDWLAETRCPIVYITPIVPMPPNSVIVDLDWAEMGRCGAQHLLELGNVAFGFYRVHEIPQVCKIQRGFTQEIERNAFQVTNFNYPLPTPLETQSASSRPERVRWLVQELANVKVPLAVMAEDDRFAIDLVFAAQALGLRIPEDIAILGTDDDSLYLKPFSAQLSSVDGNLYECGWRAAKLLHCMMNGSQPGSEEVPLLTTIPPRGVLVRQSTATFVCKSPAVTKAAMFVRKNYRNPISAEDVAAAAGVSLRRLQDEYPVFVGRSIKADILRQRLSLAERLLERTSLKLAAVAAEAGFGNIEHFCKVFRLKEGMTPLDWRQRRDAQR